MICGAGVDCVHLAAGIYIAVGFLEKISTGAYSLDEGAHLKKSKVIAWFENNRRFEKCEKPPLPGDVLVFNLSLVGHHVGLMLGGDDFIHAFPKRKTMVSKLRESFYSANLIQIYRPIIA
jgi:cell wall-associated NlpC family hydrolase